MKVTSLRDYFEKLIGLISAIMPEEMQPSYKEVQFLVECCLYNYEGNDLSNAKKLAEHLCKIGLFKRHTDAYNYKCRIGIKKWAETGKGQFVLSPHLDKKPSDKLSFTIKLIYEGEGK